MFICQKENCKCIHHRLVYSLIEGLTDEAKPILQSLKNLGELIDTSGRTLLHYAARNRNKEIVEYLIENGCNVNAQDSYGVTPLMLALKSKYLYEVEVLLKNDADVNIADNDGTSSLELAFYEPLRISRAHCADRATYELNILEIMFEKINNDFSKGKSVQWLLNANDSLKLKLVSFGKAEMIKFMLKNGYPMNYREAKYRYTALHCALLLARFESAKILVKHGVNVDVLRELDGSLVRNYISCFEEVDENSDLLTSLLRYSNCLLLPINLSFSRSVEWLLTHGKKKTIRALLLSGLDFETCLTEAQTLLTCLIRNNKKDENILHLYDELNIKFDPNERTRDGDTVLVMSVRLRYPKKVEFLLQHDADVNMLTFDGVTALSYIIMILKVWQLDHTQESEAAEITESLLKYGARDAQLLLEDDENLTGELSRPVLIIIEHLALLEAQKPLSLSNLSRTRIATIPKISAHFNLCKSQMERMKDINVYGTVTLYKLLTETNDQSKSHARNQELRLALDGIIQNLSGFQPYYLSFVQLRLSRGLSLIQLEDEAALLIEEVTRLNRSVYHAVVYKIISYLDRRDFKIMFET